MTDEKRAIALKILKKIEQAAKRLKRGRRRR